MLREKENQSDDQNESQKNETEAPESSTTSSNLDELHALQDELSGGSEPKPEEPETPNFADVFLGAEAVSGLCKTVFLVIAARAGDKWKLEDGEAQALGEAADKVLAKYMPSVLTGYGAEVTLAVTLLVIVSRRMMVTGEKEKQTADAQ